MAGNECAGCRTTLPKREFLICGICKSKYDLDCAGVTSKRYNQMESSQKSAWKCPECCSKQPKVDNTNTPLRSNSANIADSYNENLNITQRTKHNKPSSQVHKSFVTEDKLREILQQEFSVAMNVTIKQLISSELKAINEKISGLQEALNFFNTQFENIKDNLHKANATITNLTKDNEKLKSSLIDLTSRLNIVELHMRETNLEINGIPEHRSENLYNTVAQLTKAIDNPLQKEDILHITRVAKLSNNNKRPRAVVVKLRSPLVRDTVLTDVLKFNKSNPQNKLNSHHLGIGGDQSPVYVSEHLTPAGKFLHAATRKKAKELAFKFVWVRNGRIFVRKDENHQSILVKSLDHLNNLK